MRVGVTGARGLLGQALVQAFRFARQVYPLNRADADITRFEEVLALLEKLRLDVVVHTAAAR